MGAAVASLVIKGDIEDHVHTVAKLPRDKINVIANKVDDFWLKYPDQAILTDFNKFTATDFEVFVTKLLPSRTPNEVQDAPNSSK